MRKRARPAPAPRRPRVARCVGPGRTRASGGAALAALGLLACAAPEGFGTVTLEPDFALDGSGTNVDSIAFWEAPDAEQTLLLVTAKGNQRVEVWRFPFRGAELPPLEHPSFGADTQVNGIVVDQAAARLYVAVSRPASRVAVFALPDRRFVGELDPGLGDLGPEPNLALLRRPDGARWLYVSAEDRVGILDADSGARIGAFRPSAGLETMAVDPREQLVYIPDENDRSGVYAYEPDGAPHLREGVSRFGGGRFDADAEGIALYRCSSDASGDDGRGFLVVADQRADHTEFELFDRRSWEHLGTLVLRGVSNTDGVGSTQRPLPGFPRGVFAAIDDDRRTVGIGWDRVLAATGLGCGEDPDPAPAARGGDR